MFLCSVSANINLISRLLLLVKQNGHCSSERRHHEDCSWVRCEWKIHQRSEVTRQPTAPQIGETDNKIQRITAYWSRNPQTEASAGISAKV
ncbi:olfactory receptor family 1 subfamily L member 8 isoform X2 [Pan troglodytes]|uniref:olfactory receptor family 1 subfamily L member 8 isoform X2 n=1 Tax=Pan troglodytes TaxID=9598 RepID=UPI0030137794